MSEGKSNHEIGQRLYRTEHTVVSYESNMMAKLGAQSRAYAVMLAAQRGLIVLGE